MRTGCLIVLHNRELADGTNTDDLIKPQGLTSKYTVPVLGTMPEDIDFGPNTPNKTILVHDMDYMHLMILLIFE